MREKTRRGRQQSAPSHVHCAHLLEHATAHAACPPPDVGGVNFERKKSSLHKRLSTAAADCWLIGRTNRHCAKPFVRACTHATRTGIYINACIRTYYHTDTHTHTAHPYICMHASCMHAYTCTYTTYLILSSVEYTAPLFGSCSYNRDIHMPRFTFVLLKQSSIYQHQKPLYQHL